MCTVKVLVFWSNKHIQSVTDLNVAEALSGVQQVGKEPLHQGQRLDTERVLVAELVESLA